MRSDLSLPQIRCPVCNRWLMSGHVKIIQTKCPKCGNIITLREREINLTFIEDANIPKSEVHIRDKLGRLVGRVTETTI